MANRFTKFIISVFSAVFALVVISTFAADRFSAMSFRPVLIKTGIDERISLIDRAITLDPLNAEYHFKEFLLLQKKRILDGKPRPSKKELHAIKNAIDLRPLWPKYHLYYALVLEQMDPEPNIITRDRILSEIRKASELKPYSSLYQEKYLQAQEKYTP